MLNAAKSECSSVESLADFCRSPCILPAAEKTRSTPPVEAGAEKYCLTIFASAGHLCSFSFHLLCTCTGALLAARTWSWATLIRFGRI